MWVGGHRKYEKIIEKMKLTFIAFIFNLFTACGHSGEDRANPRPPVLHAMPPRPVEFQTAKPLGNLTVLILPHSHDDTGWQRSVDQCVLRRGGALHL